MKSFEDLEVDFFEIDGEFIMMPEEDYHEAVFYTYNIISTSGGYNAKGILFEMSDDRVIYFTVTNHWFDDNSAALYWLDDNQYKEAYKKSMIEMVLEDLE